MSTIQAKDIILYLPLWSSSLSYCIIRVFNLLYVEIPFYEQKKSAKKKEFGCYIRKRVCLTVFLK